MPSEQIIKALSFAADMAQGYAQIRPRKAEGALAVMRICRCASQIIESQGASVDEIIVSMREAVYLAACKTQPGIPSAIRQEIEDEEDDY